MKEHTVANFLHGAANGGIGAEDGMMLVSLPLTQGRELLGNGAKEASNHSNWRAFHVVAELLNEASILDRLAEFDDGEAQLTGMR